MSWQPVRGVNPQRLQPSLLDRLMDDAPELTQPERDTAIDLQGFKAAVARDLEMLLNQRQPPAPVWLGDFPASRDSVLGYGVPDLSSMSLNNPLDRDRLRTGLAQAIARHEGRLKHVRVSLEPSAQFDRNLRFRVDAVLELHPLRQPVWFDAMLELGSNVYQVKGQ